jgi:hypothetical protein
MTKLWIANCEIRVEAGDLPSGSTLAFSNIVTWGDDPEQVTEKIKTDLARFNWHLIACQRVDPADDDKDYGDELNELVIQAQGNPNAILLGRFFSYRPD